MEYAFKGLFTTYMTQKYVAKTPLSKVNTENKTELIPLENGELKKPEVSIRPDLLGQEISETNVSRSSRFGASFQEPSPKTCKLSSTWIVEWRRLPLDAIHEDVVKEK
ncbi:unnamed protein product [Euphydryas editha]|uniref:Uncharacterized protein n=1 Tax=Euphydryas editha TaxID=104508 RepID=A0AAU9VF52_EUPED|nr:unnamed protein product [Euphydryas editha]